MHGAEIAVFTVWLNRFTEKSLNLEDSEALADRLLACDRKADDRKLCLECRHLAGYASASWHCRNGLCAGVAIGARGAVLPCDFPRLLQRCGGFAFGI